LALEGKNDAVILADNQTQGRGRWERKWETGKGNIALSLLKKEKMSITKLPFVYLAISLAVAFNQVWHDFKKSPKNIIRSSLKYFPQNALAWIEIDNEVYQGIIQGIDENANLVFRTKNHTWHSDLKTVRTVKIAG
jgi:hypothetical protein